MQYSLGREEGRKGGREEGRKGGELARNDITIVGPSQRHSFPRPA